MDSKPIKLESTPCLKRSRYSEQKLPVKSEPVLSRTETKQHIAVITAVHNEVPRINSFTSSSKEKCSEHIELQYNRLSSWIGDLKVESCRQELTALLLPLFCHLYLEILCYNERPLATKFFQRFFAPFASRHDNLDLIELAKLAVVPPNEELQLTLHVRTFRSEKHRLKLSTRSKLFLQHYLSGHGHALIQQAIQKWFSIEITDSDNRKRHKTIQLETQVKGSRDRSEVKTVIKEEDEDMRRVLEAIKAVKSNPGPLRLFRISNVDQNFRVQCSTITDSMSILAAGVGASIKLWGVMKKLQNQSPLATFSLGRNINCGGPSYSFTFDTTHNSTISLYGHAGPVQGVAFLPKLKNPEFILSVSQDSTMRSWRLDDYKCAAAYRGHTRGIWCLDVGSYGLSVVTGSSDRTVRLWSPERNFPLLTCAGHYLDVECVQFHPNNSFVASGSADKTVRMWSVNDAKLLRLFCEHTGSIQSVEFSPNGKYLASAGEDKSIKIWDLAGGKLLKELKGHTHTVKSLSWSQNSENICSCSFDGTVRVWSLQRTVTANDMLCSYTIVGNLTSVKYSKSNTVLCISTD